MVRVRGRGSGGGRGRGRGRGRSLRRMGAVDPTATVKRAAEAAAEREMRAVSSLDSDPVPTVPSSWPSSRPEGVSDRVRVL